MALADRITASLEAALTRGPDRRWWESRDGRPLALPAEKIQRDGLFVLLGVACHLIAIVSWYLLSGWSSEPPGSGVASGIRLRDAFALRHEGLRNKDRGGKSCSAKF
jgi:hypothetical protein